MIETFLCSDMTMEMTVSLSGKTRCVW